MLLIAIIYLACAAFVLMQLGKAPLVEDEALPDDHPADAEPGDAVPRAGSLGKGTTDQEKQIRRGLHRLVATACGARAWVDRR